MTFDTLLPANVEVWMCCDRPAFSFETTGIQQYFFKMCEKEKINTFARFP